MNTNDVFLAAGDAIRHADIHPEDSPQVEVIKSLIYAKARRLLDMTEQYRKEYAELHGLQRRLHDLTSPKQ